MPRVLPVIESETPRGAGTAADRCRTVRQYHTLDGELLAENDPCAVPEHRWLGPVTTMPQRPSPALLAAIEGAVPKLSNRDVQAAYSAIYEALDERPSIAEFRP